MIFNEKTLEQLDYCRIRDTIAGYCFSTEGQNLLQKRLPSTNLEEIQKLKTLAKEWIIYINSSKKIPLSTWEAIQPITDLLNISGSTLELEDLFLLNTFCKITKNTKEQINQAALNLPLPILIQLTETIPDLTTCTQILNKIIDKDGTLKDLPQIKEIRSSMAKTRREIENLIHSYISDMNFKDALQSDVPALRGERQVLAIKANNKNKIKGIIHEVSQTGQTVYIEPDDVVQKNNYLIQLEFKLNAEIRRILKDTTRQLASFAQEIKTANEIMIYLDNTLAAARWANEQKAIFAETCNNTTENISLIQARHPLLAEKAVPIDLIFPEGCKIIIITGPNTGGKTVTLKTLALFILLNQSGFPVPAFEGTKLPICSGIFADIGDEQSLDQSLSTFSGHMKNVAHAIKNADANSLVLLDELGSGTDPQEGSAIAMATLDVLISKGAWVIVTTHHGVLKNYGFTHPACINASVEFDENTLKPTYRIKTGVPGESRALDIARRSGLPLEVTEKAATYMAGELADVSAMIRGLSEKHEEANKLMLKLDQEQNLIREKRRAVDLKELKLRQQQLELSKEDNRATRKFLAESRKQLENLVRELREGEVNQQKTKSVKEYIARLEQAVASEQFEIENQENKLEQDFKITNTLQPAEEKNVMEFKEGTEILTKNGNQKGILIRKTGKNTWWVQIGSMKMNLKEKDITLVAKTKSTTPSISVDFATESTQPAIELRLLGMRYDEAIKALERQLDLANIQGLNHFSIIHGKGNGVLQQAVKDYLSNCPSVKEFYLATPEDGGSGKTYVKLTI